MSLLEPVAAFAYRRRVPLVVLSVLLIAISALYGRGTAASLVGGGFDDPTSESSRADVALEERFGLGTPDVIVAYSHGSWSVASPEFRAALEPALAGLRSERGVDHVGDPFASPPRDALVSKDGKTAVVMVRLDGRGAKAERTYDRIAERLTAPGLTSLLGGAIPASRQAQHAAEADLVRAELLTLPLLAILLVVFFRGLIVASLPLVVGGFAVTTALAVIRLLTHVTDLSVFAMNIVTFVGLGVAIDYSLFIATRFREELHAGMSVPDALRDTMRTAGRTVGYSGGAVAVSLLGLSVFPVMVLRSIALAGSLVVLMALVGALVLLPAMLALLGPRIEWLSFGKKHVPGEAGTGVWHAVAAGVMRRPIAVTVGVTALLLLLGAPFLSMRPAVSGAAVLPHDAEARKVAELLESDAFGGGRMTPVQIVATVAGGDALSPSGVTALESYVTALEKVPHVSRVDALVGAGAGRTAAQLNGALASPMGTAVRQKVAPLVQGGDTLVRVSLDVAPGSDEAGQAVRDLRAVETPRVSTLVTSPAARLVDLKSTLTAHLPWAFAIICLATFVVLFLAFGSVIMPIKAILMNVLSLTASFGTLVFIFQEGRLEELLGYRSPGNVELTIPVVMFAVVFGLAMDYELFLLSRMREAYDRSGDMIQSVALGLEQTAQLITRAALLLVAVMVGFAAADMLLVKELGVGMIVAVIVDATVVRALLVPATMRLLGHLNWWAPGPLARWWKGHSLGIDERSPTELAAAPQAAPALDRPSRA